MVRDRRNQPPNTQLRDARCRLPSPTGSGRPMSRQELAQAINAHLAQQHGQETNLDETYIGKLERGEHRWPNKLYREVFQAVLGVATNEALGFYIIRGQALPEDAVVEGAVEVPRRRTGSTDVLIRAAATDQGHSADDDRIGSPMQVGDVKSLIRLRQHLLTRFCVPAAEAPLPLTAVEAQVHAAMLAYQSANYVALQGLPELLAGAERLVHSGHGEELTRAYAALAWANLAASKLAAKLGDGGLAWIAADRAATYARHLEDAALSGVAAYQTACALAKIPGRIADAEQVAMTAADQLSTHQRHGWTTYLSVRGALLLHAAVAAARRGDPHGAHQRLTDAAHLASALGRDGNELWTAFGPTNVLLHQLAVTTALRDTGKAIQLGEQLDTSGMPPILVSRRAQVHLDLAAAYCDRRDADPQTVLHLLEVERIAPEVIQHNANVRPILTRLLARERRNAMPGLRPLAQRAGMAV